MPLAIALQQAVTLHLAEIVTLTALLQKLNADR